MLVPEKLEGKNIIIRHLEKDDFLGYKGFMQNPKSTAYLMYSEAQKSDDGVKKMFDTIVNNYDEDMQMVTLAVAKSEDNSYIGFITYMLDYEEGGVQFSLGINEEYEGNGYASEAIALFIDYIKSVYECYVKAYINPQNTHAIHTFEKSGMTDLGEVTIEYLDITYRTFELY